MVTQLSKKQQNTMVLLLSVTYFVSYITRTNFAAIISEIENSTGVSKSLLSLSITSSFVSYGIGQIVSGFFGDSFSPKKLVKYGLSITVLMNGVLPFCSSPYLMAAVWCINGFAQAFIWPPIIKIMSALFSSSDYEKAAVKVNWGGSLGTIAVYLAAPIIISALSWKYVFLFSAIIGLAMIGLWGRCCYEPPMVPSSERNCPDVSKKTPFFTPLIGCIMLVIILQGMLRNGVTTWMPSLLLETYHMDGLVAILTGVLLPIFSIISFQVTSYLYRNIFHNPVLCSGVVFGVGACAAFLLARYSGANVVLSVACSALLTGCMHGVNLIMVSMLPAYFNETGNVSTVSGILNSCTYVGSAISTYGIAVLTEKFDWSFTLHIWLLTAILGTIIALACARPWQKKMQLHA